MITLNDKVVEFGQFPNGESNLSLDGKELYVRSWNRVNWMYENEAEFMQLDDSLRTVKGDEEITGSWFKGDRVSKRNGQRRG